MGRVALHGIRPYLVALTPAAQKALGGVKFWIPFLPFRVGCEARKRLTPSQDAALLPNRRDREEKPNNDLFIRERGQEKYISPEHFLIHQRPKGDYILVDRGSDQGTLVDGKLVGGKVRGAEVQISHGAIIIPGDQGSPYVFRFELREPVGTLGHSDA